MKKILFLVAVSFMTLVVSAKLPTVQLKSIEGESINTALLENKGKPFIISFFATWCKPCQRELNAINEVYLDWQEETGMKLIAVSIDQGQNANKVKPLVDGNGWEYEVLLDPNGDFKRAMNVQQIPAVFVIDADGNIAHRHTGYTTGGEEDLIEIIRELIK